MCVRRVRRSLANARLPPPLPTTTHTPPCQMLNPAPHVVIARCARVERAANPFYQVSVQVRVVPGGQGTVVVNQRGVHRESLLQVHRRLHGRGGQAARHGDGALACGAWGQGCARGQGRAGRSSAPGRRRRRWTRGQDSYAGVGPGGGAATGAGASLGAGRAERGRCNRKSALAPAVQARSH